MKHKLTTLMGIAILATVIAIAPLPLTAATQDATVTVNVGPEISVIIPGITFNTPTDFSTFQATQAIMVKVRTSQTAGAITGSGSITAKVSADFSPSGGPSVQNKPNGGDELKYTPSLTGKSAGTVAIQQTAGVGTDTPVITFGSNAHSNYGGDTLTLAWTLGNDPTYQTGTYTATVTYTISIT